MCNAADAIINISVRMTTAHKRSSDRIQTQDPPLPPNFNPKRFIARDESVGQFDLGRCHFGKYSYRMNETADFSKRGCEPIFEGPPSPHAASPAALVDAGFRRFAAVLGQRRVVRVSLLATAVVSRRIV